MSDKNKKKTVSLEDTRCSEIDFYTTLLGNGMDIKSKEVKTMDGNWNVTTIWFVGVVEMRLRWGEMRTVSKRKKERQRDIDQHKAGFHFHITWCENVGFN